MAQKAADAAVAAALSASAPAPPDRKLIHLKFSLTDEQVTEIARNTLRPLLEEQAPDKIGQVMPDGSLYAGLSPETGNMMFAMPCDAKARMDFNAAAGYALKLNAENALGHDDWRVPTLKELHLLFNNLADAGGFVASSRFLAGRYWSSLSSSDTRACSEDFLSAHQSDTTLQSVQLCVRCVR